MSSDIAQARGRAINETVATVRGIVSANGVTRASLDQVKAALVALSKRVELFPDAHFPAPVYPAMQSLYRLSIDSDGRNALYIYRPAPGKETCPHNHATWASWSASKETNPIDSIAAPTAARNPATLNLS